MKLRLILLLIAAASGAVAGAPEDVFEQGNRLYREGRMEEARGHYERLVAEGYESASLFFNLGNACYRMGDLPRAILHYERARRLAPGDEDILHNLQLASQQVPDRIEEMPRLALEEYRDEVDARLTADARTWLAYGFLAASAGCYGAFLLAGGYRTRRMLFFGGGAAAALCVLFLALTILKIRVEGRAETAVVTAGLTTLKNSPEEGSTDAFVLHGGAKVRILNRVGDWMEVRIADGKVGWMPAADAEAL
ncbi:MAG: tetratricopeptide repeat protein [Bacteroidota bacterium]